MPAIKLEHAFVDLPIYNSRGRSLKSRMLAQAVGGGVGDPGDKDVVVIRALNDITLSLQHGDRLALVGHNGAGKTTLLRVMAGIYPPTAGRVDVIGRIACLTDLNVGMDTEATGFENIMIRGVLMGLSKPEVNELTSSIAEFTELGDYLSLPVRTYSQGMLLRLAFAMSTLVQPEVILLDEVVGVGDKAFADKARTRLDELITQSSILVLASHDAQLVKSMCTTAIWLEHGQVRAHGPCEDIVDQYHASVHRNTGRT